MSCSIGVWGLLERFVDDERFSEWRDPAFMCARVCDYGTWRSDRHSFAGRKQGEHAHGGGEQGRTKQFHATSFAAAEPRLSVLTVQVNESVGSDAVDGRRSVTLGSAPQLR